MLYRKRTLRRSEAAEAIEESLSMIFSSSLDPDLGQEEVREFHEDLQRLAPEINLFSAAASIAHICVDALDSYGMIFRSEDE